MTISIVVVRGILSELRSRGLDTDVLLQRSGLSGERLLDIRETLTVEESIVLVEQAMDMTGDPGLGLSLGANVPENMLQVFGHLILSHSTIRQAFTALRRYAALVIEGPTWNLIEQGDVALFTFEPSIQLGDVTRFCAECTLALSARIGSHFTTPQRALREVRFQHPQPAYAERYAEVFDCPVSFGREVNALVFTRELLDVPQMHADDTLRQVLRETADRLLHERAQSRSVTERVRTLLRYEQDLSRVDVNRLARHVGLSPRALRRRLGSEGSPLSALLDEARCRVACHELRRPESTIKETAELLGFSEPSAFHRAFKRWTGRTPAEYSRITMAAEQTPVDAPTDALPANGVAAHPAANTLQASRSA
ncbi:MAG: AraC family transcriptional regulator [Polyangiales bacterium]